MPPGCPLRAPSRLPWPAVDAYLQIASVLGCEPEPPRLELATLAADEAAADAVWRKWNLPPGERVVVEMPLEDRRILGHPLAARIGIDQARDPLGQHVDLVVGGADAGHQPKQLTAQPDAEVRRVPRLGDRADGAEQVEPSAGGDHGWQMVTEQAPSAL